jgi:hypothetical protein
MFVPVLDLLAWNKDVAGFCEQDNERLFYIKWRGNFLASRGCVMF